MLCMLLFFYQNISPVSESVMVSLLSNIKSKINVLICTSTDEEASYVHQV